MASPVLQASAALKSRVARPSLLKKLAHPEDLIPLFPNGAYIGWSGFTGVGYPKYVPLPINCQRSLSSDPELHQWPRMLIPLLQENPNDARRPCRKEQPAGQAEIFPIRGCELGSRDGKPLGGTEYDRETGPASSWEIHCEGN